MTNGSRVDTRAHLRWAGAVIAACAIIFAIITLAMPTQGHMDGLRNPLAPPDTESPRRTFTEFHKEIDEVERLVREAYDEHIKSPGWFQSKATKDKIRVIKLHLDRATRCLDLSEVPPGNRAKVAMETAMLLDEIVDRVGQPPLDSIPDAAAMKARIAANERPQWTVPNTEIRIARVESGPRAGEYLFTADTVSRAYEYYRKISHVPAPDGFDFYSFYALSPGDWLPPKWYSLVQQLPPWFHLVYGDSAHWQWLALAITIVLTIAFIFAVYRGTRDGGFIARRTPAWAPSVALPALIQLALWCAKWVVDVLNLTGPVQQAIETSFEVLIYLNFTWLVVSFFNALSDWVARAWSAQQRSFDSGVLRVGIQVVGILIAAGLLSYGASQVGVPLVGILAGLGVGGLAVALAAQPTMENLIGGLMIYADRPVRVGDHCRFGDMSGVVEEIGIRSTRVRTADRSITSIPNGEFSKLRLTNYSQRDRLIFNATLALSYDVRGDQLRAVLQKLRELLQADPKIRPGSAKVHLSALGAGAMEIDVSAELDPAERSRLAEIREDLFLRMFGAVEEQGAKVIAR